MPNLRVSLIQAATVWHDAEANRRLYGDLVRPLAGTTDLIVLPETFTSGFSNDAVLQAETMDGPSVAWMARLAGETGAVVTGSMVIREGERVYNRMLWMRPDGSFEHYDKRHLFRMADEHQRYAAGQARRVVEIKGWRVLLQVCYDLRFPVFMRNRGDYDLIVLVANWPAPRRQHWRTLLRARAMENLACVIGVNRVGVDGNGIDYSGDSVVLDMQGGALVELGAQPMTVTVELSRDALDTWRARFPAHMDADAFDLNLE
ncbi:MAG TPA: amidohydrolase [Xanthomonadaceae bacterium]|nr:amidohydrolase [Xanthomonadaceae bacterium]